MRRLASIIMIMAAAVLLTSSALLADESMENRATDSGRDECLLVSMNCANEVDSINMRIERLNREIAKGTDIYTRDELNVLRNKLQEATTNLESIVSGG